MTDGDVSQTSTPTPSRDRRWPIPVPDITTAGGSVVAAITIALVVVFVLAAEVRPRIGVRGGLVAWMATAVYASAVAAAIWAARRSAPEGRFRLVLPITAALMLGQDLRWGADVLRIPLPTLSGIDIGGLVDLREVVSLVAERLGLGLAAGSALLAAIGGATTAIARRARRRAHHRAREVRVVTWFAASIGCAVAVPALGVFGESTTAWFATEMACLLSGSLLVMAALAAGDQRRTVAGWRGRIWPWSAEEGSLVGIPSDQV